MNKLFQLAACLLLVSSCDSSPGVKKDPPLLKITAPERSLIKSGAGMLEVRGEVTPNETGAAVDKVMVNGVQAIVTPAGTFSALIEVQPGATLITTEATDVAGGKAEDTRAVHAGEIRSANAMIDDAMAVGLSDDAMHAIGKAAGNALKATDMAPLLAPYNPVVAVGLNSSGGEDCLYGKVSVYDLDMSNALLDMKPVDGGIAFTMELQNVKIPMHARYGAACINGDTDIELSASKVRVTGMMEMWAEGDRFAARLADKQVTLTGFEVNASGVPGAVLDILHLDSAAAYVIEKGAEMFMAPAVEQAFAGVAGTKTLDLQGQKLDVEVIPSAIYFDAQSAHMVLSTRMQVQGTESSAGFIYTPNSTLDLNPKDGFKFGFADDAANQLLAGFTAAGLLNVSQPALGGSFDTANVKATLPPLVSADPADGRMKVIVGDLMMTFTNQGAPVGRAAMNLAIDLKITGVGADAKIELGKPEIHVTTINDELANSTGFLDADLALVTEISVKHQIEVIQAVLGSLTLPSFQGVAMSELSVAGDQGYVVVSGDLK
jgi:hypothetical protein